MAFECVSGYWLRIEGNEHYNHNECLEFCKWIDKLEKEHGIESDIADRVSRDRGRDADNIMGYLYVHAGLLLDHVGYLDEMKKGN